MKYNAYSTVRIKTFLNSANLTDTNTSRVLYQSYSEMNEEAVSRLMECDMLLQKRQKIEAVSVAQKTPELFGFIDSLLFPERQLLVKLADLYGWTPLSEINADQLKRVKSSIEGMNDLRPLLMEFRRIARTGDTAAKLHLLREISQRDKDNAQWQTPLAEVENRYLSQLISEAQRVITEKDFQRLDEIYTELTQSQWSVNIPDIVLKKISRIMEEYRQQQISVSAKEIIERINTAYSLFDKPELADAVVCWREHCAQSGYVPTDDELGQFNEAERFLQGEREKEEKLQQFQDTLNHISYLIDSSGNPEVIEKHYSELEATGLDIPEYITRRMERFRSSTAAKNRNAVIFKVCRVATICAVTLFVIAAAAVFIERRASEQRRSENLLAEIKKGNFTAAENLLKEIETRHPELASSPGIAKAKAALYAEKAKEVKRKLTVSAMLQELGVEVRKTSISASTRDKLDSLSQMVKTRDEKQRLQQLEQLYEINTAKLTARSEKEFLEGINVLDTLKGKIEAAINAKQFDLAQGNIDFFADTASRLKKIPHVKRSLFDRNSELIGMSRHLQEKLNSARAYETDISNAGKALFAASTPGEIISSATFLKNKIGNTEESDHYSQLIRDAEKLETLLRYQSNPGSGDAKPLLAKDVERSKTIDNRLVNARNRLNNVFSDLSAADPLSFLRFKDHSTDRYIDLYIKGKAILSDGTNFTVTSDDDTPIRITKVGKSIFVYSLLVGDTEYPQCSLIRPANPSNASFHNSRARHQVLIEMLNERIRKVGSNSIFDEAVDWIKMIAKDRYCAPYWKMQLVLHILQAIAPLDMSHSGELRVLEKRLAGPWQNWQKLNRTRMVDPERDRKIIGYFSRIDYSSLAQVSARNKIHYQLFRTAAQRSFSLLGVCLNSNGKQTFSMVPDFKGKEGDVYCFDTANNTCLLAGRFDANGIFLEKKFRTPARSMVLFTTEKAENIASQTEQFIKNPLNEKITQWPEFWPINLRNDEK